MFTLIVFVFNASAPAQISQPVIVWNSVAMQALLTSARRANKRQHYKPMHKTMASSTKINFYMPAAFTLRGQELAFVLNRRRRSIISMMPQHHTI
jgi:hypothetical protein